MSSRRGFLARPEGGSASLGLVIRTDIAVLFVGDEDEKQALLPGEPDVFVAPG